MTEIEFSRFSFYQKEDVVLVIYGSRYQATLPLCEFTAIDIDVIIEKKKLIFPNAKERVAEQKVDILLQKALHSLTHLLNSKEVIYIDEQSQIPLIGAVDFGVVDRGTNILEVKPLTGCNLNCIYCSVDEGENKKSADILVDDDYLISVCEELASIKKHPVEFNIGPHAEPMLYPFIIELIQGLKAIPQCIVISMNSNGTLLSKERIDELKNAGLTRINWSLNTLDEDIANKLSQKPYSVKQAKELIMYADSIGLYVQIAPLIVPTFNDDVQRDLEPILQLAKSLHSPFPTIGIQKFLCNKGGRNPVEEIPYDNFFKTLFPFEEKYDLVLTPKTNYNPYGIFDDVSLEKPMHKNQIVKAKLVSKGRVPSEKLCVAFDRVIRVKGVMQMTGFVRIKIVRDKHNIYLGVPA
jgi:uncharacterized protein